MTRVALRYGGEEYVVRESEEEVLTRITYAIDGAVLRFKLADRKFLHLRIGESTPIAVVVTQGSPSPVTPPMPTGIVTSIKPDDVDGH